MVNKDNDSRETIRTILLGSKGIKIAERDLDALIEDLDAMPQLNNLQNPEVRYEVTDLCNASCIMCPREEHLGSREHGIMANELFFQSVDEVIGLGAQRAVLTGFGEPFLDKNLETKIEHCKRRGLYTYVITNGSIFTSKRSDAIIDAGLDEIRISFYGMGPASYNAVMQGLNYERTKASVHRFLDLKKRRQSNIKVQISFLLMEENAADLESFKEYWEPLVDFIEIWKPHNFGDGRSYRARRSDQYKKTCGRPFAGPLQIDWDGTVVPCCFDYKNAIPLGNAFSSSVLDVLNSPQYRLLRLSHNLGKYGIFPYCDQCDQLLERSDALIYSNKHQLTPEEAVKYTNTGSFKLEE